ncbi:hemerythrin domain-containing protein [Faecalibacter macacae]|uniref:Hemerythrin domain-containing protein n=1 Tax=Faecalibacter macacae TaxID=1859289 RepID=A0A3L9MF17_9FLAO|nr:hemerythrin domain-containing protein [Faecalibacter macacae]RLZ11650.1 hemerythrin domain-containing protein [Faecalibacter macacae]
MKLLTEIQSSTKLSFSTSLNQTIYEACSKHHKTLFFCWNIRTGIDRDVDIDRIVAYVNWYGENVLFPKMEIEEKLLFTILSEDNYLVKRALKEHRRLRRLFKIGTNPMKNLIYIEEELDLHIRFEEKNILSEIENIATQKQLKAINEALGQLPTNADWNDHFWE